MFTLFPHRWVSAKPSRNAFRIGHSRASEAGRWIPFLGWSATSPQRRALHRPGNNAHHGEARQDFSGEGTSLRASTRGSGTSSSPTRGKREGSSRRSSPVRGGPTVAGGRRGEPSRFRRAPVPALALSPRPPAHPGAAARGGRGRRRAHLIVRGGGGGGGGGGAAEPRQDVAEAVVAVQLGLALGALDGALSRRRLRKPCARGDKRGKGRRG